MSNIYRTADVQRLITSRDDRIKEAFKVLEDAMQGMDKSSTFEEIMTELTWSVAQNIETVERRCYSRMWDAAANIPQFDPDIDPKDCFHCKRMMNLCGSLCYGHLGLCEEKTHEH